MFAKREVQAEVMDAYEKAFRKTRVLLRYPVGPKHEAGPALRLLDDGDSMIGTTLIGPDEKAQDRWTSRGEDPLAR